MVDKLFFSRLVLGLVLSLTFTLCCALTTDKNLTTIKAFLGPMIEDQRGPATIIDDDHHLQFSLEKLEEFFKFLCDKDNYKLEFVTFTSDTNALMFPVKEITNVTKDGAKRNAKQSKSIKYTCTRTGKAHFETVECTRDFENPETPAALEDLDIELERVCDFRCIELSFESKVAYENFGRGPFEKDLFCVQPYNSAQNKIDHFGNDAHHGIGDDKNDKTGDSKGDNNRLATHSGTDKDGYTPYDDSGNNKNSARVGNEEEDPDNDKTRPEMAHHSTFSDNHSNPVFILLIVVLTISLLINALLCILWCSRYWKKKPKKTYASSIHIEFTEPTGAVENRTYTEGPTRNVHIGHEFLISGEAQTSHSNLDRPRFDGNEHMEMNTYNIPSNEYESPDNISLPLEQSSANVIEFDSYYASPRSYAAAAPVEGTQDPRLPPLSFTPEAKYVSSDEPTQIKSGCDGATDVGHVYSVPSGKSRRTENVYTDDFPARDQDYS